MLFYSICIRLSILKHLLFRHSYAKFERWSHDHSIVGMLVKIHHHVFWEFRVYIQELSKLADMGREVVQEMHIQIVEMRFFDEMLCNFWRDLSCIFINAKTLCSRRKIVPSGVTLPFLLWVQSKLLLQGLWDHLNRCTGAESTENILVTMKLLQIILHVLYHGISMVPVLWHKVTIHWDLDGQQGFSEGNPLVRRTV